MTRRHFRWTAKYRQAHREARMYFGQGFMYHGEPSLVRRYRELWEAHRQGDDLLKQPRYRRYRVDDDCPF